MKFNWVTFKVSDMEKSVFFYHELLELEIAKKFESNGNEFVMFGKADGPKIELIHDKNFKNENPVKGVSVGLEIDELDKMVEKLKENGRSVTGPISPNPHIRFFFVKDPDGYNIQLVEQK
ncbi:MAG: VOC family protein [Clostridia bacterium]|jgi:lactoylglutathione lyase|nr:VOC family protein [Clostridia bacterium]